MDGENSVENIKSNYDQLTNDISRLLYLKNMAGKNNTELSNKIARYVGFDSNHKFETMWYINTDESDKAAYKNKLESCLTAIDDLVSKIEYHKIYDDTNPLREYDVDDYDARRKLEKKGDHYYNYLDLVLKNTRNKTISSNLLTDQKSVLDGDIYTE